MNGKPRHDLVVDQPGLVWAKRDGAPKLRRRSKASSCYTDMAAIEARSQRWVGSWCDASCQRHGYSQPALQGALISPAWVALAYQSCDAAAASFRSVLQQPARGGNRGKCGDRMGPPGVPRRNWRAPVEGRCPRRSPASSAAEPFQRRSPIASPGCPASAPRTVHSAWLNAGDSSAACWRRLRGEGQVDLCRVPPA